MIIQFIKGWSPAIACCSTVLILLFSILTLRLAKISNRNLRFWTLLSLLMPVMTFIILVVIPKRNKHTKAVTNDELFDHLFVKK